MQKAVLAGGCFWGVEELIRQLKGVTKTEVGYCGGSADTACYEEVKKGKTGHAEAILVEFDPQQLSFADLLYYFFRLHDPTTLNRQGNDIGTQYRSVIFCQNEEQRQVSEKVIAQINALAKWPRPIVTELEQALPFYPAEKYHQDYLQKNPEGYTCHFLRA